MNTRNAVDYLLKSAMDAAHESKDRQDERDARSESLATLESAFDVLITHGLASEPLLVLAFGQSGRRGEVAMTLSPGFVRQSDEAKRAALSAARIAIDEELDQMPPTSW